MKWLKRSALAACLPVLLLAWLWRRDRRMTAWAAAALAAVGLAWIGARAAHRAVARDPAFTLASARVTLASLPAWLDAAVVAEIHRSRLAALTESAVDRDAAGAVGRAVEASPWVAQVLAAEVDTSPRIRLDLRFREPVARVPWGGREAWVDEEGILLPKAHYRPGHLPRIQGLRVGPPARAGLPWADPGLAAGLEVLGLMRADPDVRASGAAALEEIDVSNVGERRPGEPEVVCLTRGRVRLRFCASPRPGRPALAEQVARLGRVVEVDRGLTLARNYVDLRFGRPVGS